MFAKSRLKDQIKRRLTLPRALADTSVMYRIYLRLVLR